MWRMVSNSESDRSSGIIVETVAGNRSGVTNKVLDPFNLIAAPAVIPAKAGIQEGGGAVVKGRQVLPDAYIQLSDLLSCPLCGHVLHKPLDSGLRRNDGGGNNPIPLAFDISRPGTSTFTLPPPQQKNARIAGISEKV